MCVITNKFRAKWAVCFRELNLSRCLKNNYLSLVMEYYFYFYFINHVVRANQHMIGLDKLSELAQDCCGWKKIVVACSAADSGL